MADIEKALMVFIEELEELELALDLSKIGAVNVAIVGVANGGAPECVYALISSLGRFVSSGCVDSLLKALGSAEALAQAKKEDLSRAIKLTTKILSEMQERKESDMFGWIKARDEKLFVEFFNLEQIIRDIRQKIMREQERIKQNFTERVPNNTSSESSAPDKEPEEDTQQRTTFEEPEENNTQQL